MFHIGLFVKHYCARAFKVDPTDRTPTIVANFCKAANIDYRMNDTESDEIKINGKWRTHEWILQNREETLAFFDKQLGIKNNYHFQEMPDTGYGRRFKVTVDLVGENGKTAKVLTAWILDKNTNELRLTSVYIDKK